MLRVTLLKKDKTQKWVACYTRSLKGEQTRWRDWDVVELTTGTTDVCVNPMDREKAFSLIPTDRQPSLV